MSAEYMHVGIPITKRKLGMTHNKEAGMWLSNPDDYDYKIEYIKFEEGTTFPEILHRQPHVAYKVDDMKKYLDDADEIIVQPMQIAPKVHIAFIIKDNAIFELYEDKN